MDGGRDGRCCSDEEQHREAALLLFSLHGCAAPDPAARCARAALQTGRAASMKHFVRTGADEAIVRVTIHNKPYKVGGALSSLLDLKLDGAAGWRASGWARLASA